MSTYTEKDIEFIVCCLKNITEKPNFDAVAQQLGLKNAQSA